MNPRVKYKDFWPDFNSSDYLLHRLFVNSGRQLNILGPFSPRSRIDRLLSNFFYRFIQKADFFVTAENRNPKFGMAKKQIGFWRSFSGRDDVFRFPYWMYHLDWCEELENQPPYPRYGVRLSIDRLMRPISESYIQKQLDARLNRAVIFSSHLIEPRKRFFELVEQTIGCDGFGNVFGRADRSQAKMPVMENYRFSLCPENSIGDGYITEKIPEAFHSGCIPITWCRPEDLAEDFNPAAVVNLYGLDDKVICELMTEIQSGGSLYRSLLNAPLLLYKPTLYPLLEFLK
jgi:hypothetical protein